MKPKQIQKVNGQTIELFSTYTTTFRKTNAYNVAVNGKDVEFSKSWVDDEYETDTDYDIDPESKKKLTEEELDALTDYINDL